MSSLSRTILCLALAAGLSACAAKRPADAPRPSANLITRDQMEAARYASLYDVVQALHSRWLQSRGPNTLLGRPVEVQVMVDDMRMGGVDVLRSLKADNVVSISFVDPVAAAQRWGGKYAQGTIVVTTRADGAPAR